MTIDRGAALQPAGPAARRRAAAVVEIPPGARPHAVPTAAHVMNARPPTADENTSLWTAWGRLRGPDNRHVVVVDHRLHPRGVLEERDLALAWPPGPLGAQRVPLRRLVADRPRAQVRIGDDLGAVARTMLVAGVDAVPVVDDDGRLAGLITARHCVELLARRLVHW